MKELPEGHFNEQVEGPFLVSLVEQVKELKGWFIEVGSLYGKSSVIIGQKIKEIGDTLLCIDIWGRCEHDLAEEIGEAIKYYPERSGDSLEIFQANVERFGLDSTIDFLQARSEEVCAYWESPIRFVFIDGCHEYEFVKRDTEWRKHLVNGGFIVFHDYHTPWAGVKKAVDEVMNADKDFVEFANMHTIKAFKRVKGGAE